MSRNQAATHPVTRRPRAATRFAAAVDAAADSPAAVGLERELAVVTALRNVAPALDPAPDRREAARLRLVDALSADTPDAAPRGPSAPGRRATERRAAGAARRRWLLTG